MQLEKTRWLDAYRRMLRIRMFEEEGTRLFRAGKIAGAFHASIGQEAAIVGACMALRDDDSMTGTHRSHGHPIGKGAALNALMAELMGKTTGICKGRGGSMHLADKSVGIISESAIVGGGIPLATGCALSAKVRGTDQVSLCFFGDGAVNQGTFHESLNMASLWQLAVVFFCENNGYAIATSVANSHGQPSIAKRADAYGMPSAVVDGQDILAVYEAASDAAARARNAGGPTLIEAKTYRFDEHNVGLVIPGRPYRSRTEIEEHKTQRDPLAMFKKVLIAEGFAGTVIQAVESETIETIRTAIDFAERSPLPDPATLCDDMYSNPTMPREPA